MKTLLLLVTLAPLCLFSVAHADIRCTTASGDFQYSAYYYSGGAAPPPGMKISRVEWRFHDDIVSREIQRVPCIPNDSECVPSDVPDIRIPGLVTEFIPDTEATLYETSSDGHTHRKYVTQARLIKKESGLKYQNFLICELDQYLYP